MKLTTRTTILLLTLCFVTLATDQTFSTIPMIECGGTIPIYHSFNETGITPAIDVKDTWAVLQNGVDYVLNASIIDTDGRVKTNSTFYPQFYIFS